jgi:predicted metal-dependent HD superfamily phosphohydrolase
MNLKEVWSDFVEERHLEWTWKILDGLYSEPHRVYHNHSHIGACLRLLRDTRSEISSELDPGPAFESRAALALLWHDAVYVPGDKRNEQLSAELLRSLGPVMGQVPRADHVIEHACQAILATKTHETTINNPVDQVVIDIDLSILGADGPVYDDYVRAIREEYSFVSDEAWRVGRLGFLEGLRKREYLFNTRWAIERFERQAWENIYRELGLLG